jgi:TonB-linked SusC/RagA family outer membrane protein
MKKLLLTVLPILLALASYGQRTITGVIKDMKGDPIIGANVIAKEDITIGTITDIDGSFKLVVNQSVKNLTLSYTGYTTKEVNVENVNQISEILAEGKLLDEVVVVGYGTQKRSNLTGSISSIKGADIASSPIQSFDQGLQGRAAGVQITTPNGVLNNPPVIRIRGTNSINLSSQPLIVIDGVPTFTGNLSQTNAANNPLANINPNDIESYEILKDASASAIYGSRAAAGVILITTKKGKKGTTKVNYEGWVGTTSPMRLFDMLSGPQYLEIKNEALANNNNPARFVAGKDVSGNDISTRWYDHTHQTGTSQSHAINFSGGSDKTNFYVSLGYSEQEGFLKDNTFDRLTTRVNLDHSLTKRIKVGSSISYTNTDNKGPNSGIAGGAFSIAGLGRLPLVLAPIVSPYINAQGQGSQTLDPGFDYNLSSVNTIGFMGNTLPLSFF